jgi:hypothetical protein
LASVSGYWLGDRTVPSPFVTLGPVRAAQACGRRTVVERTAEEEKVAPEICVPKFQRKSNRSLESAANNALTPLPLIPG